MPNDLQGDTILLWNPRLPTLEDEGRRVDTSTTEAGEQRQVIPNLGDGRVPFSGVRFDGGEVIGAQNIQLDEDTLK